MATISKHPTGTVYVVTEEDDSGRKFRKGFHNDKNAYAFAEKKANKGNFLRVGNDAFIGNGKDAGKRIYVNEVNMYD